MKFMNLPDWLYFPIKFLLMASFLIPVLLWGGRMLGYSVAQETALATNALQDAQRRAEEAQNYIDQERDAVETSAAAVSKREENEARHLLAVARNEIYKETRGQPVNPVGHAESARGIDVSHYEGLVRWDRVAQAGIHFAYVKATGGKDFVDRRFHDNWHGMRTTEIYRGAYHFFYAADDPLAQAEHFVATVRELRPMDLPPVLDVEITDHTDKRRVIEGALIWLKAVEKSLGRLPIVYTDPGFGDQYLNDSRFSKYPLWIADYAKHTAGVPSPWKKKGWTFWQHSQEGAIEGIEDTVDLNVFNGTVADLEKFIAASGKKKASK